MMRTAFDEGWIDMYPREGKSGGAFCSGYYAKNISRVMTNFAGSASDVSTLAHELGHAFNNRMLHHKPLMMTETPMPLAETASTFNETLLISQLLKTATPEEELTLLDSCLTEQTQTMVDIYSRFLFEQKVVAAQADHALDVDELKETMLWAQEQSYGDGLDPEYRHPYMWACKSHYYSTGVHFYNFPYAFGGLFARGLYARYEKEGEAFVPVYCDLLSRFGSDTIANVTASVGIDVTTPDFWREAVESVLVQVRRFVELADQETAAK
ncbi:MAG: M3 family metallopeptidase [Christensenellales bacterium]